MGFFKATGKLLFGTVKVAGKAAGHALHGTAKFVGEHRGEIASAVRATADVSGKIVKGTGSVVARGAGAIARRLHNAGSKSNSTTSKVLMGAAGYTADAISVVGKATQGVGSAVESSAPAIGGATGGAINGVLGTVSGGVDSVVITDADFEHLHRRLQLASAKVRAQSKRRLEAIALAQRMRRKDELLDLLVVGGVSLAEIVRDPSKTPPDVERAFELAYPDLARGGESFADVVERLPADNLVGLVSGVKGKLFEIELVEHLNDGALPGGFHAELAPSVTQRGHDIIITDAEGHTADLLQAKATESAAYVQDALERYPDIDVMTTSEVYSQLVAHGSVANVADSGISEATLQAKVEAAAAYPGQFTMDDLLPSSIGLAIIAMSSFMDKNTSLQQRGDVFGGRAAKASITAVAAKAALIATNTWWLGLAVGVGSQWLTTYGGNKRQRYETLAEVVRTMERRARRARPLSVASTKMLPR